MNNSTADTVTLSRSAILKQKGMVVLPIREYRRLCEMAVPTYYLKGKEAEELDKLVRDGLKEYRAGKTIKANSLGEALKIYERRTNKKH